MRDADNWLSSTSVGPADSLVPAAHGSPTTAGLNLATVSVMASRLRSRSSLPRPSVPPPPPPPSVPPPSRRQGVSPRVDHHSHGNPDTGRSAGRCDLCGRRRPCKCDTSHKAQTIEAVLDVWRTSGTGGKAVHKPKATGLMGKFQTAARQATTAAERVEKEPSLASLSLGIGRDPDGPAVSSGNVSVAGECESSGLSGGSSIKLEHGAIQHRGHSAPVLNAVPSILRKGENSTGSMEPTEENSKEQSIHNHDDNCSSNGEVLTSKTESTFAADSEIQPVQESFADSTDFHSQLRTLSLNADCVVLGAAAARVAEGKTGGDPIVSALRHRQRERRLRSQLRATAITDREHRSLLAASQRWMSGIETATRLQ
eukprot:SAG31_NODE_34_length_31842_cov_31.677850_23_plen_370_part_00